MPSPSLWTHARAALDPYARRWAGQYLAYPLTREEYVATVDDVRLGVRNHLRNEGYEAQRLSAAKRHPETEELHVLSMRKVPEEHPPGTIDKGRMANIAIYYQPHQCQYHVHAFPSVTGEGFDVYSHYELRPDPWPLRGEWPGETIRRLRTHYRPEYESEYLRGLTDVDW